MKQRDASGEIVRCSLMLGICCMHACDYGRYMCAWWVNCFYIFWDGFAFLSGWYGIRFSIKKFAALWGIGLFCAVVDAVGYDAIQGKGFDALNFMQLVKMKMFGHWYLNCYAVLMLLAPLVNEALERLFEHKVKVLPALMPFFCLVFGWSWLVEKGSRWFALPVASGLGSFTFLTLLGIYVVGRLCRYYEIDRRFPCWQFAVLWLAGTLLCVAGLGWYASPFTVLGAVGLFFTVKGIRWPDWLGKIAVILAPSVFSVYLLHEGPEGYWFVQWMDKPGIFGYLLIASLLFSCGIVIDIMLRRFPLYLIRRCVHAICK